MKKLVITLYAVLLGATFSSEAAEPRTKQQQMQQNGQFQIVPVEYIAVNSGGNYVKKAVLKIDSVTGKTWILKDNTVEIIGGKIIFSRGWEELESYLEGFAGVAK